MSQQMAKCLISLIKDLWIILHFNSQPCKGALLSDACLYVYNNKKNKNKNQSLLLHNRILGL